MKNMKSINQFDDSNFFDDIVKYDSSLSFFRLAIYIY